MSICASNQVGGIYVCLRWKLQGVFTSDSFGGPDLSEAPPRKVYEGDICPHGKSYLVNIPGGQKWGMLIEPEGNPHRLIRTKSFGKGKRAIHTRHTQQASDFTTNSLQTSKWNFDAEIHTDSKKPKTIAHGFLLSSRCGVFPVACVEMTAAVVKGALHRASGAPHLG